MAYASPRFCPLHSAAKREVNFRTATDGGGSTQHPRSSDVLKQSILQSFKTRRFGFDKDVKNQTVRLFFIKFFKGYIKYSKKCCTTCATGFEFLQAQVSMIDRSQYCRLGQRILG
ncbi:hypothetical protein DWQ65_10050 [Treponema phagedenis]|uniref:Uncharacterized protein n=1 Tax=Treponema phagedenis TaxID=162 RepID=A0AAF1DB99_TREPH|nr:hypothetical protein FUT79_00355 [Treponema phagedenis]QEJ96574.1 hypothetical protein FUT82_00155 [Treponema phagedenis]QEJ99741.1 hypothetical protein FUT84_00145 [Treponema phagedenis]QEK02360.1 hypothetical protein FUT83_00150 [Treponema phagedenis]QEK07331.1 hypothetical protein FUT80_11785 [Treponema phagedenis]